MRKCMECGRRIRQSEVSMFHNGKEYHHLCGIKVWNTDSHDPLNPEQCLYQLLLWQRRSKPDDD